MKLNKIKFNKLRIICVVIVILALSAGGFLYFSNNQAKAAWYSGNWQYRKKLTFNNTSYGALTNQPVSIELTSANFDFGKARSDGFDIVFTDSDGTTLLTYTRETFSAGSQSARFWVKVPAIDASSNSDFIYVYYGNASAGNTSSAFANSFFSGVAGYLGMEDGNRTNGQTVAESVSAENMTAVAGAGTIDNTTGARGNALTFNGTDEYLTQKVWDTKQGTVTASMAATVGFINDSGQDFSPYVGASGSSKPYMLVATDSAGLKAWGYIGEQGTGETYTDIIGGTNPNLLNGDFTNWTGTLPNETPTGWTKGAVDANNYITQNPSGQCQFISSGTQVRIYQMLGLTGKFVKFSIGVTNRVSGSLFLNEMNTYLSNIQTYTGYQTPTGSWFTIDSVGSCNITVDNVVLQQVLTPTTNGVKIYSTKTGTTQSWANVETGFNANAVSSYEIRKTDFQITGALTVGAWVKYNASDTYRAVIARGPFGGGGTELSSYGLGFK